FRKTTDRTIRKCFHRKSHNRTHTSLGMSPDTTLGNHQSTPKAYLLLAYIAVSAIEAEVDRFETLVEDWIPLFCLDSRHCCASTAIAPLFIHQAKTNEHLRKLQACTNCHPRTL